MRRAIGAVALVAMVLGSGSALAAPARLVDPNPDDGDYAYDFFADNLQGDAYGVGGAVIRVRDKVVRRTLIRPRISFVSHLLKSVEAI